MSTKTATATKKPAKTNNHKTVVKAQTIKELTDAINGDEQSENVRKILGLTKERAEELDEWVECEGTSAQAMKAFTSDLTDLNELAYAYYHFGIVSQKYVQLKTQEESIPDMDTV